jgi:hypothetical protein
MTECECFEATRFFVGIAGGMCYHHYQISALMESNPNLNER